MPIRLGDIPYSMEFYWKGERYKQVLRPKGIIGKFTVVCVLSKKVDSDWIDMPSGRIIKPCVRAVTKHNKNTTEES